MANKYKMEQSIIKYRRRVKYVRPLEALVKILDGILLNGMEAAGGSGAEQCHVLIYILKIRYRLLCEEWICSRKEESGKSISEKCHSLGQW